MRKLLFLIVAIFIFSGNIISQNLSSKDVPDVVNKAFLHKYPNTTYAKWELKNNNYVVAFKFNLKKNTSLFDKAGNWLETKFSLKQTDLTIAIRNAIKKSFSKYKITQISKVESKDKAAYYEVLFSQGNEIITILFVSDGKIIDRKVESKE